MAVTAAGRERGLDSIYAAALGQEPWSGTLATIASEFGASSASLYRASSAEGGHMVETYQHSPVLGQEFVGYWRDHCEWGRSARRAGIPSGEVVTGAGLIPTSELHRTAYYADFLRVHDIGEMVGSLLYNGQDGPMPFTHICWYRPPRSKPFEAREVASLRRFVPHLQRAIRLHSKMSWLLRNRGDRMIDAIYVAAWVVDAHARVIQCNDAATAFLRGDGNGSLRAGKLRSIGQRCTPTLAEALAACTPHRPIRIAGYIAGSMPQVLACTVVSLGGEAQWQEERGLFLVLVELPRQDGRAVARAVAGLFALTPAEARVLGELLVGASPAAMAETLGISLPTVRTQMSAIFAKTQTRSQTELLLLLRGMRF